MMPEEAGDYTFPCSDDEERHSKNTWKLRQDIRSRQELLPT